MEQQNGSFWVGDWHVRPSLNRIAREGETVQVEPRIMDVLVCLAEQPGEVVTRERLIETVWPDTFVGDDPLNRAISELRKVFGDDPRRPLYIETIRKTGYRLIAPVRAEPPEDAERDPADHPARPRTAVALGVTTLIVLALAAWWMINGDNEPSLAAPLRPLQFTSYPGHEYEPAFSTTGDQVAFSWDGPAADNFDLYVKLLDAETPLRLTTHPGRDDHPTWSPDDQTIAFTRSGDEDCVLLMVPALGGPERRLATCHDAHLASPTWSPDGASLAYVDRQAPEMPLRIHLLAIETLDTRPLTDPPPQFQGDAYPAFSPDGTRLAFVRTSISGVENIFLISPEGGSLQRLTDENQRIVGLAWLNDSDLVYASDRDGTFSLWRLSTRDGAPEWLLTGGDGVITPTIDRQRGRLIYARQEADKNIWKVSLADTAGSAQPLIASTRWDLAPHFAPTRPTRIAFMSNRSGSYEVWMADADGSDPLPLTAFDGGMVGTPRWSPDGQHVAFDTRTERHADIYVVAAAGGLPRRLTTSPADDVAPSWSRDGQWIYFASTRSGAWEVWKTQAAGGEAVQVTRNGGFAAFESVDGATLYFTKRDAPGLWQMPVLGGNERILLDRLGANDWGNWVVTETGVYFLERRLDALPRIVFFDFDTRMISPVFTPNMPHLTNPGLALAPDGRSLAYVQIDHSESDLMMVELE